MLLGAVGRVASVFASITGGNSLLTVPVMMLAGMGAAGAVATNMFVLASLSLGAAVRFLRSRAVPHGRSRAGVGPRLCARREEIDRDGINEAIGDADIYTPVFAVQRTYGLLRVVQPSPAAAVTENVVEASMKSPTKVTQRRASAIRPVASVAAHLKTKRWNDPAKRADGRRVLVCRYRPRSVSKQDETWNAWLPHLGPSRELHADFYGKHGPPIGWTEFRRRYVAEMKVERETIAGLAARVAGGETITLLCSSACTDPERCHRTLLLKLVTAAANG